MKHIKYDKPLSFAIPFNPLFMGEDKKRDKNDNLDSAIRLALNNIFDFCRKINGITNKRIIFTFLYDMLIVSNVTYSDKNMYFLDKEDYLVGVNAINKYIKSFNDNFTIQMREWDVVGDGFLGKMQHNIFLNEIELKNEFITRKQSLEYYFANPVKFNAKLEDFKIKFLVNDIDSKQTSNWLRKIYTEKFSILTDDQMKELASKLDKNIELFKLLDNHFSNETEIIRLSPHKKSINEINKFGFSFFPKTCVMLEPWTSDFDKNCSFVFKKHK